MMEEIRDPEDSIRHWFMKGRDNDASYVILIADPPGPLVLPVYVFPEQNINSQIQRCMELGDAELICVLDLKDNMDDQIDIALACFRPKTGVEN